MEAASESGSVGRYEIVGKLAQGGMAEILLGRLTGPSGFERSVVIKRILPVYAEEQNFVDMFLDEARIAARINHPNVVQHHELGRDEGQLYLVMEYLEGESLASLQRRARSRRVRIGLDEAAYIVAEAAAGLHAAHEMTDLDGVPLGIVHRDISPGNLFVTYSAGVKIMDFGIAKAADRITVTEAGSLKGKFAYMSPEQAAGGALDRRSDVFSLGIVLYELTTGRALFRRATRLASLRAVTDVDIVPPSRFVAGYPADLEAVCLKALASDPKDRYRDAESMRSDILRAMRRFAPDALPQKSLKQTMHTLFADRLEEKREMLRRVTAGGGLGEVPAAEVDRDVELPSIVVELEALREEEGEAEPARPRRRAAMLAVGALTIGVAAAVLFVVLQGQPSATGAGPTTSETSAPRGGAAEDPGGESATTAQFPEEVSVALESEPPGARVSVDGREHGETPTTLDLPRGEAPLRVVLERDGYATLRTEIVPDVDQRLRLSLTREARSSSRRRRPPPSGMASSMMTGATTTSMEPEFPRFN